jgi:hypothetical protein
VRVTVGDHGEPLAPRELSEVEGVAGSYPVIGAVAPVELLAVAECARAAGGRLEVGVDVEDGAFTFSARDVVARVVVTDAGPLDGVDEALFLDAPRLAAFARCAGDGPVHVGFTAVDGGAVVALVAGDAGDVVLGLHARCIED